MGPDMPMAYNSASKKFPIPHDSSLIYSPLICFQMAIMDAWPSNQLMALTVIQLGKMAKWHHSRLPRVV